LPKAIDASHVHTISIRGSSLHLIPFCRIEVIHSAATPNTYSLSFALLLPELPYLFDLTPAQRDQEEASGGPPVEVSESPDLIHRSELS